MDFIEIEGFKSIKSAKVPLSPINILIGANGSGKSNFILFFEFLNQLYEQKIEQYIALNGGSEKILHKGSKITNKIKAHISFNNRGNGYSFVLEKGSDSFIFDSEGLWYGTTKKDIKNYQKEAFLKTTDNYRAKYIINHLNGLKKYHFHDTGKNSPFNYMSQVENDCYFLYEKGENLAANWRTRFIVIPIQN